MIISMTGYGRAEVSRNGLNITAEVRSVNNRFLEITTRLPRTLSRRENDFKDLVKSKLSRGSLNAVVKFERKSDSVPQLTVDTSTAKSYYNLLNQLRKAVKIRESVKLEHLLTFSEFFEGPSEEDVTDEEWGSVKETMLKALDELNVMRRNEGQELSKDLKSRINWIDSKISDIAERSKERIPQEHKRLQERIVQLLDDRRIVDQNRLELEVAILADKFDVTEECVRFNSHNKFFIEAMESSEPAGRKLGFLLQEMNREANTIGSKSNDAEISHSVVAIKEELEKIREQLQNVE